jgi:hypothetical protein
MKIRLETAVDIILLTFLVWETGTDLLKLFHQEPQMQHYLFALAVFTCVPILLSSCRKNVFKKFYNERFSGGYTILSWTYRGLFLVAYLTGWLAQGMALILAYFVQVTLAARAVKVAYCENVNSNG